MHRALLMKIGTVAALAVGIALAVVETLAWSVPGHDGIQRLALTAAIIGVMRWTWTSRGMEYRVGYLQGRLDADEARMRR